MRWQTRRMDMFPFWTQISWGLGLVLAALTLGGSQSLPWALAALGGTVTFGAVMAQLADDLARQQVAQRAAADS